ncbi:MAG: PA0069 family radical SAM protein, partial [Methylocella sp.]
MPIKAETAAMVAVRRNRLESVRAPGEAPASAPLRPLARLGVADALPAEPALARAPTADGAPRALRRGRGALSNASGRFEKENRRFENDGWDLPEDLPPVRTQVTRESAKTIVTRNESPDLSFDRSINPYRGCEHGCVYCFARPAHAYLGLSPGLDFESRLFYKPQAAALLAAELRKKGYSCRPIALGSNTDPYQPVERKLGVTRAILEVLRDFRHPVTIVTKGALIQRDLDILAEMAKERLAIATVSVTTLDRGLARVMEPRPATPERRIETIAALANAGVPTGVLSAPMIPALND